MLVELVKSKPTLPQREACCCTLKTPNKLGKTQKEVQSPARKNSIDAVLQCALQPEQISFFHLMLCFSSLSLSSCLSIASRHIWNQFPVKVRLCCFQALTCFAMFCFYNGRISHAERKSTPSSFRSVPLQKKVNENDPPDSNVSDSCLFSVICSPTSLLVDTFNIMNC